MKNVIGSAGQQAHSVAGVMRGAYQPGQNLAAQYNALPVDDLPLKSPKNQLQKDKEPWHAV
jgi:hypothetical protein